MTSEALKIEWWDLEQLQGCRIAGLQEKASRHS